MRLSGIRLGVMTTAVVLATALVPPASKGDSGAAPATPSIGNTKTLVTAYSRWKATRAGRGEDRRLVLPLQFSRGVSNEFTQATGRATLDLADGSLSVQVTGLPAAPGYEVWLIDNIPGPGRSVRPESGDRMVQVGELAQQAGVATLRTRLETAQLRGFVALDQLVVTPVGKNPEEATLLAGSPSLFQRMYYSEQLGRIEPIEPDGWRGPRKRTRQSSDENLYAQLIPAPTFNEARASETTAAADGGAALAEQGGAALADGGGAVAGLIADGEDLFLNGTFGGNGRTCGTCHPPENNFTIDPAFIAGLPPTDPLFVNEFVPELANLEDSNLLRNFALIKEDLDGFGHPPVFRAVQHVLALSTSIASDTPGGPDAVGWSGDGAPGAGTLRDFATGAVIQHAPLTLARVPGVDFILPTEEELDAMEAFQLSLGRAEDPDFNQLTVVDDQAALGQALFMSEDSNNGQNNTGKCNLCHFNAGAISLLVPGVNDTLDTGVENVAHPAGDLPPDEGFGACGPGDVAPCGNGRFNTQTLIEAADTAGFFHNNVDATLDDAIAFYGSGSFNNSPAGNLLRSQDSGGVGIALGGGGVGQIEAFLRVLNAVENIRSTVAYLQTAQSGDFAFAQTPLSLAIEEIDDAIQVLIDGGLHADAQAELNDAKTLTQQASAIQDDVTRNATIDQAISAGEAARELMILVGFRSIASEDGRIRESSEESGIGGRIARSASSSIALRAGDASADRQYRSIVSFDTSSIPDDVTIFTARLEITRGDVVGTNPFLTHGTLLVDVMNGAFGGDARLDITDFEAPASAPGIASIVEQGGSGDLHTVDLSAAADHINKEGRTQLRLRFSIDDDDNLDDDFVGFFSSDSGNLTLHPRLVVTFGIGDTSFTSDPIAKSNAEAGSPYNDSIAGDASDPDPSAMLEFSKVSGPAWLSVASDGTLSGTPSGGDAGPNSWTVQVSNGVGGLDQATLNVFVVDPANLPPFFTSDPIVKPDGESAVAYSDSIAGDASGPEVTDVLTFGMISGPAWLDVASDGSLTGTPGIADIGLNSWTVEVTDNNLGTGQATLEITVDEGNLPPEFDEDPFSKPNAEAGLFYSDSIAGDATDPNPSDVPTFAKLTGPAWLSVALDGAITGTPGAGDIGANSWTVEVSDPDGETDEATLNIFVVDPSNLPPAFNSDPVVKPNASANQLYADSLATDASGPEVTDVLIFSKISGPAWLDVATDGTLSGTPQNSDVGLNSWTVAVMDDNAGVGQATLEITVDPGFPILTFESIAPEDGRIRESNEDSNAGGSTSRSASDATALRVGDASQDRQYVFILSFDTSALPDAATVVSASLELTRGDTVGTDPFGTHGALLVDVVDGTFGSERLQRSDFEAPASISGAAAIANQGGTGAVHTADLGAALGAINTTGRTQLRIRFALDDDDDGGEDFVGFLSSETGNAADRPKLVITFME